MRPGEVPVQTGSRSLLTPRDQRPVSLVSRVQGLGKELPATHFFRNSDATSSRAVSAPKKAREPRYMRATGTSFMPAAMCKPWKEREGPSVSTRPAALPGRGTEDVWGAPARARSARALSGSNAYLARAQRGASYICTRRAGDWPGRGGPCRAPGSPRFPPQLLVIWLVE